VYPCLHLGNTVSVSSFTCIYIYCIKQLLTVNLLVATGFYHVTSADQDELPHSCCLIMTWSALLAIQSLFI
jgi:hypothetical protein